MRWLSSPKVRLALIVNGLYFISLFTPTPRHGRPHLFAHTRELRTEQVGAPVPKPVLKPDYAPFPPPSPRSRAVADESNGLLNVSLDRDLTLVRRPGRELLLSLNFSARTNPREVPEYVYLTFHLYTDEVSCPYDCPVNIIADNKSLTPVYTRSDDATPTPNLQHERVQLDGEQHIQTKFLHWVGTRISFQEFIDIISAQRVLVGLGPDWVELTDEQLLALRDMHRRLPHPSDDADSDEAMARARHKRLVKRRE